MKNLLLSLTFFAMASFANAQTDEPTNNDGGTQLSESNLNLGIDLQTKYIWRGMEMITQDAAPVVFPSLNYSNKGFYAYVMGGYAFNGKYSEVDLMTIIILLPQFHRISTSISRLAKRDIGLKLLSRLPLKRYLFI